MRKAHSFELYLYCWYLPPRRSPEPVAAGDVAIGFDARQDDLAFASDADVARRRLSETFELDARPHQGVFPLARVAEGQPRHQRAGKQGL